MIKVRIKLILIVIFILMTQIILNIILFNNVVFILFILLQFIFCFTWAYIFSPSVDNDNYTFKSLIFAVRLTSFDLISAEFSRAGTNYVFIRTKKIAITSSYYGPFKEGNL